MSFTISSNPFTWQCDEPDRPVCMPPILTGVRGFDAGPGGLDGVTILASCSSSPFVDLALAVTLSALEHNRRLGAIVCGVSQFAVEHVHVMTAMRSGTASTSIRSPGQTTAQRAWAAQR